VTSPISHPSPLSEPAIVIPYRYIWGNSADLSTPSLPDVLGTMGSTATSYSSDACADVVMMLSFPFVFAFFFPSFAFFAPPLLFLSQFALSVNKVIRVLFASPGRPPPPLQPKYRSQVSQLPGPIPPLLKIPDYFFPTVMRGFPLFSPPPPPK